MNKQKFLFFDERRNFIMVFSFFFSWLLAFPFEGKILFALAESYELNLNIYLFGSVAAHFLGLIVSGLFIKTMGAAKKMMRFTVLFCIMTSCIFLFSPSILWILSLFCSSFFLGCCVASCGYFLRNIPKSERMKTLAEGLIWVNILMIALNSAAVYFSAETALIVSLFFLIAAFLFAGRLTTNENIGTGKNIDIASSKFGKSILFLCIFIFVITIDSGLMYQVQGTFFAHLENLTNWYWAVPYIGALAAIRFLPSKINRTDFLYAAVAMIGFSYIGFMVLDRTFSSYLIVDTLIMAACGIFDLFWWSILAEMLESGVNPAAILGIGLSANVLGVLSGSFIGTLLLKENHNSSILALSIVCLTLILLPPLNRTLTKSIKDHAFLNGFLKMESQDKEFIINHFLMKKEFTDRESEIASLLMMGKSYKTMAFELHVSENTIKTHVKNVYSKAGVHNRTELMNRLMADDQIML